MNIQQAINKSRILRVIGCTILAGGALFYFVTILMTAYDLGVAMQESKILWKPGTLLQNLINHIYQITASYIGFVWRNVPRINHTDLLAHSHLMFMGLVGAMIVGGQLNIAGKRLRDRINKQIEKVEEMRWCQSMLEGTNRAAVTAKTIGQVNIYQQPMPPSSQDNWWTRPWGVIGLGIISGYVVAVLAKQTGML